MRWAHKAAPLPWLQAWGSLTVRTVVTSHVAVAGMGRENTPCPTVSKKPGTRPTTRLPCQCAPKEPPRRAPPPHTCDLICERGAFVDVTKLRVWRTSLLVQWLRICFAVQGTGAGKFSHAMEQLSPCATTTEAHAPQLESSPQLTTTRENLLAATKTQCSQK